MVISFDPRRCRVQAVRNTLLPDGAFAGAPVPKRPSRGGLENLRAYRSQKCQKALQTLAFRALRKQPKTAFLKISKTKRENQRKSAAFSRPVILEIQAPKALRYKAFRKITEKIFLEIFKNFSWV